MLPAAPFLVESEKRSPCGFESHRAGIARQRGDLVEEHRRRIAELTVRERASNVVELRPRKGRAESLDDVLTGTSSG